MKESDQPEPLNFADLVREHQVGLRAFIRRLGVRKDSVDDLAQETFLLAHMELESFRQGEDFGKWLRGLARNLVRNELRKLARRCRIHDEGLTQYLIKLAELQQDGRTFQKEDFAILDQCVQKLSEKSRQLIEGKYEGELSSASLAEKFKMSATAVRLSIMRSRKQLRECVGSQVLHG